MNIITKIRFWLIKKLAGETSVILNVYFRNDTAVITEPALIYNSMIEDVGQIVQESKWT